METIEPNNEFIPVETRPQFLSVLCILTWVCSGLLFVMTLWGAIFQPTPEEAYEQVEKIRKFNPEAADQMEIALENQTPASKAINTGLTLVGLILTVFGTIQMWQLRKKGFYFYVTGEILPYLNFLIAPKMAAMSMSGGPGGANMGKIIMVMMLAFDVIFIAMYAINIKHMKK